MAEQYNYPYTPPAFLQGQSADEIHSRMLEQLPVDIDKSEASISWDFTRPAALEKAEFTEFTLNETIKLIFPQWSYGEWLELHGEKVNVLRRAANCASGVLEVTGTAGTVLPKGYQFATPASLTASILFETVEETTLEGEPGSSGQVTCEIAVQAVEGGLVGNVPEDTVKLMVKPISGIAYVTNPKPMTGGAEAESDADYLIRILDAMRNGSSMTGCNADYIRWGKEVPGVGQILVDPEWPDPELPEKWHFKDVLGNDHCSGAVRLIVIDSNGFPANQQILDAVYSHIAGNDERDIKRLMPIGAKLTVIAPTAFTVDISAAVVLEGGAEIDEVMKRFRRSLDLYWLEVGQEATENYAAHVGYIRWVQVGAVLAKTAGIKDYTGLLINGNAVNIPITYVQYPVTGEVTLRVKT